MSVKIEVDLLRAHVQDAERVLAVAGRAHAVAGVREHVDGEGAYAGVVLDDEDALGSRLGGLRRVVDLLLGATAR